MALVVNQTCAMLVCHGPFWIQTSMSTQSRQRATTINRLFRSYEDLPQLVLLGLVIGVVTGLIILGFRWLYEYPLNQLLPGGDFENFEGLPRWLHFALPATGGIVIGLFLMLFHPEHRKTGVAHVMERMNYHHGRLKFTNLVVQFFGTILAILTGQSAGRYGPAVHIGSATGSLIGQHLHLPGHNLRILVGCGAAAAISASFNTPLAGVIFAMEVILLEYTVAGFTPIIIASVAAALISTHLFSDDLMFSVPAELQLQSPGELPFVLLFGFLIGAMGALFSRTLVSMDRFAKRPILLRMMAAGAITGLIALFFPQVMGLGNDTITEVLAHGETILIATLIGIAFAKLFATSISVGLGMPMGLVGPTLFIGATLGGGLGALYGQSLAGGASDVGIYAMLGMAGMMSAVLNAPLAALIALLELTNNPHILLPGMLTIVIGNLTCRYVFKQSSVFVRVLQIRGLDHRVRPIDLALTHASVSSIMNENFRESEGAESSEVLREYAEKEVEWLIFRNEAKEFRLIDASSIKKLAALSGQMPIHYNEHTEHSHPASPVSYEATLKEAFEDMAKDMCTHLVVVDSDQEVLGVLTRQDIENYYLN